MGCYKILRDNYLDVDILANREESSELSGFPASNAYNRERRSRVWRSGGYFKVESGSDTIVFRETTAVDLTATVAAGEYTSATALAAAIETALEAAGASDYTVTHTTTLKFKIESDGAGGGGIFELRMEDANSADMADLLGFDTVARTGGLSYTADELKIHSEEFLLFDLGVESKPDAFVLVGPRNKPIKISETATVKIEGNHTDNFSGTPVYSATLTVEEDTMAVLAGSDEDSLSPVGLRYWRLSIVDQNPNGFIEVGALFLGRSYSPSSGTVQFPFQIEKEDRSTTLVSEGGVTTSDQREKTDIFVARWDFLSKQDREDMDFIFEKFGTHTSFFISQDGSANIGTDQKRLIRLVKFLDEPSFVIRRPNIFDMSMRVREEI